ncbi:hypothetical protein M2323_001428 [Rhodoblastus acidophilus]|uniref:DUF3761 domain-containing protein n=1 Tax=Rhodoblastus acidophilus TaxID=1074 RepID=UPI0031C15B8A|nr:hypothetical protein [Rhodoblastus acidophilus]MCW2332516.1 hypothetical protein [Rhodoblastus acidophilus]
MKGLALALAAIFFVSLASNAEAYRCNRRHYRNYYGVIVHSPSCGRHGGHKMAICRDGSRSYSHHRRGTCSRHHGVKRWL